MNAALTALLGATESELTRLARSPFLLVLVTVQAITFLFLVTLFGMTGAFAPTALIDNDNGPYAKQFIKNLNEAHHSFDLRPMDLETARAKLLHGDLVAIIIIPNGFSANIAHSQTVPVRVIVDNIDTDMTADIQRALPAAITRFGKDLNLEGIRVQTVEHDLIDHETDFISYMIASALVLNALIIAGVLSAVSVAGEFETGTAKLLLLAPVSTLIPMLGRMCAASIVAVIAEMITVFVALFFYHIKPAHPIEMVLTLLFCVFIFSCIGVALGALMKKTLPVASFIFGLALPLYLASGSYEPERFDGNAIWIASHFFPLYYATGIIEHAVHDLKVTPEPVSFHFLALCGWAVVSLFVAWIAFRKEVAR